MAVVTVDFDGTLFQGNSFTVMFEAGQTEFDYKQWTTVAGGLTKAAALGMAKGKNTFRHEFFKGFAKTFRGKRKEELDEFFKKLVEIGENDVHYGLVEKVREHQQRGDKIILVSGALEPFLQAFIHKLQLDVHIIGTELIFYPNGFCTGEVGPINNGNEKVRRVREWLYRNKLKGTLSENDLSEVWAYADSESDIPLFEFAHHPVVVNPTASMEEIAERNKWPIFA